MNTLVVHWNGRRVGLLVDQGSHLGFRYDEGWLAAADACALSRQLPLRAEEFSGQPVAVFFGGLLPEADARDQIARNLGISSGKMPVPLNGFPIRNFPAFLEGTDPFAEQERCPKLSGFFGLQRLSDGRHASVAKPRARRSKSPSRLWRFP